MVNLREQQTAPDLRNARFIKSVADLKGLPADDGREVAFAGRSNAGKSSALNAIVGRRGLARISKTPGRTQLLNFFDLGEDRRLVDLPGYGYARVPDAMRRRWGELVQGYLNSRASLAGLFLIMDARHPLKDFDYQLLQWCRAANMPCHAVLTKSDKLGRGALTATHARVARQLEAAGPARFSVQTFSALKGEGLDEARTRLMTWLQHGASGGAR